MEFFNFVIGNCGVVDVFLWGEKGEVGGFDENFILVEFICCWVLKWFMYLDFWFGNCDCFLFFVML